MRLYARRLIAQTDRLFVGPIAPAGGYRGTLDSLINDASSRNGMAKRAAGCAGRAKEIFLVRKEMPHRPIYRSVEFHSPGRRRRVTGWIGLVVDHALWARLSASSGSSLLACIHSARTQKHVFKHAVSALDALPAVRAGMVPGALVDPDGLRGAHAQKMVGDEVCKCQVRPVFICARCSCQPMPSVRSARLLSTTCARYALAQWPRAALGCAGIPVACAFPRMVDGPAAYTESFPARRTPHSTAGCPAHAKRPCTPAAHRAPGI